MRRSLSVLACLALVTGVFYPTPAVSQDLPSMVMVSVNRDSILEALKIEMRKEGLSFKRLNRDRALFEMDTGRKPVRGEMVTVILETTVRFSTVPSGTRLDISEVLSAALMTGSERRTPDPALHWDAYMAVLDRIKTRLERPEPSATSREP